MANVCLCVRASRRAWQTSREKINGKEEKSAIQIGNSVNNRVREMESEKRRDRNSVQPWRETLIAATCYLFVFGRPRLPIYRVSMVCSMFERNLNEAVCIWYTSGVVGPRISKVYDRGMKEFLTLSSFVHVINNWDVSLKILIV